MLSPSEPPGFEELLENGNWVRRLARRLLYDESLVDDVVQEVWITAWQKPPDRPSSLRAWLASVVRSLAYRANRSQGRRQRHEARAARPGVAPGLDEIAQRLDLQRQLIEAVMSLKEPYRSVVYLHFFEDLRLVDVALRLGTNDSTVRTQLGRGLEQLREKLTRTHGDRQTWTALLLPLVVLPQLLTAEAAAPGAAAAPGPCLAPAGSRGPWRTILPSAAMSLIVLGAGAVLLRSAMPPRTEAVIAPAAAADTSFASQLHPEAATAVRVARSPAPADGGEVGEARSASGPIVLVADAGTGAPIAGARVFAAPLLRSASELLGTTDAAGRLAVPPAILRRERLQVLAAGYLEHTEDGALRELEAEPRRLELRREGRTRVLVLLPDGAPAAGATVRVTGRARGLPEGEDITLTTGANGEAEHVHRYRDTSIDVTDGNHGRIKRPLEAPVTRVRLAAGLATRGRVLDAEGRPVADAAVLARSASLVAAVRLRTDERGGFDLGALAPDEEVTLDVHAAGLPATRFTARPPAAGEWMVRLERGAVVTGVVRDAGGQPVAGGVAFIMTLHGAAEVQEKGGIAALNTVGLPGRGRGRDRLVPLARAALAADGAFALGPIASLAAPTYLFVMHPRLANHLRRLERLAPDLPLEVTLETGRVLAGRLVTPFGEPIGGAMLHLGEVWSNGVEGVVDRQRTAADGTFRFDGVPSTLLEALPGDAGSDGAPARREHLFIAAFPPDELLDYDGLAIEDSGLWNAFSVNDAVEHGGELVLVGASRSRSAAWTVRLWDAAGEPVRQPIRTVVVSPEEGCIEEGVLLRSLEGARLFADETLATRSATAGVAFLLPEGYRWQEIDLAAAPGASIDLELAPLPDEPEMVTLVAPGGEPSAAREVLVGVPFASPRKHALVSLGATGTRGEIDVGRLPPGRHVLVVRDGPAAAPAPGQVELIAADGPAPVTVEIDVSAGPAAPGPLRRSRS